MAGGTERHNFSAYEGYKRQAKKLARNVVLIGGTLGASAGFVACGDGGRAQTNTPEATVSRTAVIKNPSATFTITAEANTVTPTIEIATATPTVEKTPTPDVDSGVNQQNFTRFLDTNPDRFVLVDGDGVNRPLRAVGGLDRKGKNLLDTTTGEVVTSPVRFLELVGPAKDENKAKAILFTVKEGAMSDSEVLAEVDFAKSEGVDISGQMPSVIEIAPDLFDIKVWELNRHSCEGKDANGNSVWDPSLITVLTYRVYQPYLPIDGTLKLAPDVRGNPIVPVSETGKLNNFPKPDCKLTE